MSRPNRVIFQRGALTDWLLEELNRKVLTGDGVAPEAGGWAGGMPGQGAFTAYCVLSTSDATPASAQPLAQSVADDWTAQYSLFSAGGERNQADYTADKAREVWIGLTQQVLDLGSPWKLYRADISRMGGVTRNDQVDPPYWQLVDALSISLTRERT